jgi:hypothetical protein
MADRPANREFPPSRSSMRRNRLNFATRSLRPRTRLDVAGACRNRQVRDEGILRFARSAIATNDLSESIGALGDELSVEGAATFRLVVEGPPRKVRTMIRDEIYRVAREPLRNVSHHAQARHIEAEITYGGRTFLLRIRDDGEGIPPEILEQGRPGHYGVRGMRSAYSKSAASWIFGARWRRLGLNSASRPRLRMAHRRAALSPTCSKERRLTFDPSHVRR